MKIYRKYNVWYIFWDKYLISKQSVLHFISIKAFEYTGKILGKTLANFVTFSQPEAIILTGGLAHSGKWILNPTIKSFNKNLLPFYQNKVKILLSGLEDKDSAILGSAALVWKNI